MRRFFSYGPIDTEIHYYASRKNLIERTFKRLMGEDSPRSGHYVTVWAPRQCGKTWIMQEVAEKIKQSGNFEVGIISMERTKDEKNEKDVLEILMEKLQIAFQRTFPPIDKIKHLPALFTKTYFKKPVILVLDEFDALDEVFIDRFASVFRDMYISRTNEKNIPAAEKTYLLHGMALVGVRSVLGIESDKGSPFNVQQSLHIPNLTHEEVKDLFLWYKKESKQEIDAAAIDRLYEQTRGQPGLTCWLGELLTDTYNKEKNKPVTMDHFEEAYAAAIKILPNNNILNIISKADKEPYKQTVLELFKTDRKMEFTYDNKNLNYLYLNGVVDREKENRTEYYAKFSSPFVQKRLFNYFSNDMFKQLGRLMEPLTNIDNVINTKRLNIKALVALYQDYLDKNKQWLFKDVPRRSDQRIYESVFHFNLYAYLNEFLRERGGRVFPEFPTGNGKIDLLILSHDKIYGIELKSFTDQAGYRRALTQAARYGKQLRLPEIHLVNFIDTINDKTRHTYETDYHDPETTVTVKPIFIKTGSV